MYNKLFTLSDLFHNEELKGYLPQVYITNRKNGYTDVKFKHTRYGEFNYVDEIITITKIGAMPYMKKPTISMSADGIVCSGEIRKNSTIQQAYEGVLYALQANATSIGFIGSYNTEITDVMKKIRRSDRYKNGDLSEPKLYLRINSLNEIKYMTQKEKEALLKNVVENIYFSDDFKQYREPSMERHSFIVNNRNVLRGYDSLKREFDRKVRY